MNLQPYQQRVVEEKAELDKKLSRLEAFMNSISFIEIDAQDAHLLREQWRCMTDYSNCLSLRIERFSQEIVK